MPPFWVPLLILLGVGGFAAFGYSQRQDGPTLSIEDYQRANPNHQKDQAIAAPTVPR